MEEAPVTRASLLVRIRDSQDADAWRDFLRLYGPVVYGYARKRGLQDADAADLMQDVLRSVATAAGRLAYDRNRGTFRGWLFTVTRNRLYTFLDERRRQIQGSGDPVLLARIPDTAAPNDSSDLWDREYEQRLFDWAAEQVRCEFSDQAWQAFWLTAVDTLSAREVGSRLGMSPGAVYVAKSRILARLRQVVRELQEE